MIGVETEARTQHNGRARGGKVTVDAVPESIATACTSTCAWFGLSRDADRFAAAPLSVHVRPVMHAVTARSALVSCPVGASR